MAPYWITFSAVVKIAHIQGKYEPLVMKRNTFGEKVFKVLFLTFIGPLLILISSLITLFGEMVGVVFFLIGKKSWIPPVRGKFMDLAS